jgi:WD40 repeat protein
MAAPPPPGPQWRLGPRDPAGVLVDLSDRPLLCCGGDPRSQLVVVGGSDHAAYVLDARAGALASTLFGRTVGHTEWVTGAVIAADGSGRVLTCAMDGRVLVWPSPQPAAGAATRAPRGASSRAWSGPPPLELVGHFGSITTLVTPDSPHRPPPSRVPLPFARLVLSAGYDKTLRLWLLPPAGGGPRGGRGAPPPAPSSACVATLRGHGAPVLCVAGQPMDADAACWRVASGDRDVDGTVRVWEVAPAAAGGAAAAAPAALGRSGPGDSGGCPRWDVRCVGVLTGHRGHCTALAWVPQAATNDDGGGGGGGWALVSGAQDGCVRVWRRAAAADAAGAAASGGAFVCSHTLPLHTSVRGSGAVSELRVAWGSTLMTPATHLAPQQQQQQQRQRQPAPLVVTASADGSLAVLGAPSAWAPSEWALLRRLTTHGDGAFLYALALHGGLALSGDGAGQLLCHDVVTGEPLWAVGANTAAVRCIAVADGGSRLVVAGDDGKALVYDFSEP